MPFREIEALDDARIVETGISDEEEGPFSFGREGKCSDEIRIDLFEELAT